MVQEKDNLKTDSIGGENNVSYCKGERCNCSEELYCATANGQYGFMDNSGNWIIQPVYDELDEFNDGLCRAKTYGRFGFIDLFGNWVIKPIYEDIEKRFDADGNCRVLFNGKYGFIDKSGNWVLEAIYDYLEEQFYEKSGGWCDKNFDLFYRLDNGLKIYDNLSHFIDGICCAKVNGRFGFIDRTGKWVIQPISDELDYFRDGLCRTK